MAIHSREDVRDDLLEDVYASTGLSISMPKHKIPERQHDPRQAYVVVHDELMLGSLGWPVPAQSMPANRQDLVIQSVLVRHGVTRDLGSLLVTDMARSIDFVAKHPITTRLAAESGKRITALGEYLRALGRRTGPNAHAN
jgi:glutamate/tyrosine decarboxylase-like PLP-dependent enzyme